MILLASMKYVVDLYAYDLRSGGMTISTTILMVNARLLH